MNYSELISAVYTETNRPDLVDETKQSVLEATTFLHATDDYYKDIQEAQVVFDNPSLYIQQLDISSLPFFRNTAYVRKTNPILTPAEQTNTQPPSTFLYPPNQFNFMRAIEIGSILDDYGYEKQDVYYQGGSNLNFKSSTPLQYLTIGWYRYPNVSLNDPEGRNFESWIAREYPYAIVYKAAGNLFAKIGEDKSWAIYMKAPVPRAGEETGGLFYQQLANLRKHNLVVKG